MAEEKLMENILFFDAFKAHADYGKNLLESDLNAEGISVFVKYDLKNLNRFIAENHIEGVVLFINDSGQYHQLLPFIALGLKVLVCATAHEIHEKGLEELEIPFLDLGLPKKDLFRGVRDFLFNENISDTVT